MKARVYLALPFMLAALAGCTNPNAQALVSGKVTYNNNPVTGGTIAFKPENGPEYNGIIDANGNYTLPDVPPGTYKVAIETESINPDRPKAVYGQQPGGKGPEGGGTGGAQPGGSTGAGKTAADTNPGKYVKIPAKYGDANNSGLTITVTSGGTKKDFPLTD